MYISEEAEGYVLGPLKVAWQFVLQPSPANPQPTDSTAFVTKASPVLPDFVLVLSMIYILIYMGSYGFTLIYADKHCAAMIYIDLHRCSLISTVFCSLQ